MYDVIRESNVIGFLLAGFNSYRKATPRYPFGDPALFFITETASVKKFSWKVLTFKREMGII